MGEVVKKSHIVAALLGLMTVTSATYADAQRRPRDPGVNARQHHQRDRIQQGVKSGELTRNEAQELRTERRDIRQTEQEYRSDGVLTKAERKDLHQELNQQSREIHEEKHDEEKRTP